MNNDDEMKDIILDIMMDKLKNKYPDVKYSYTRCEFFKSQFERVPNQDIRDSFPEGFEISYLSSISDWRIAELPRSGLNKLKVFKKELMNEVEIKQNEIQSLKILSQYKLSTNEVEYANELKII